MLPDLFVLTGLQPLMAWQIVLPAIDATIVHLKFVTSFHRSC